jgi:hypothetical protein
MVGVCPDFIHVDVGFRSWLRSPSCAQFGLEQRNTPEAEMKTVAVLGHPGSVEIREGWPSNQDVVSLFSQGFEKRGQGMENG